MGVRPLPAPKRDEVREEEQELWDQVLERHNNQRASAGQPPEDAVGGYYGALLNAPGFCYHQNALGRLVRQAGDYEGSYSHADREWVDQVLCSDWKTNVVMGGHLPDALAQGVRLEAIIALREGREEELTDDERLLTDYIRAVVTGSVTDELFEQMRERMGTDRGVTEYTYFIMFLTSTMRLIEALTGSKGPSDAEIDAQLKAYQDGTTPLPKSTLIAAG
jgi:hypothetical protein